MEYLIQQRRVRFSGVGQDSEEGTDNSTREGIIPSQKTESFQGDSKAQRQFSREMSPNYDVYESDFATAIAAAAFAIYSAEEASSEYQKKMRDGIETPMSRVRTRREEQFIRLPESSRVSNSARISGKEAKDAVEASMRIRMDQSQKGEASTRRSLEVKADAWENSAMAKITKRYEKMNSAIVAWENEKKMKAKLQMERKKRELELRSALHLQHYQNKLARIDHTTGGARVQMEEKRRNEESQVKEKARRVRSTGKVPVRCFCF